MTCRAQHLGRYLEGQCHSMTLQQNPVRPITLWFEVEFYNYSTGMITIMGRRVVRNIWVTTLNVKVTAWPCSKIVSVLFLCYLKSGFQNISQKWSPHWDDMSCATFGSLPWRSRSQHDLAAKSCPSYYFVIWSQVLKIFQRNDHHIEMTCRAQHRVRPKTLWFEVEFYNYSTGTITILRRRVVRNIWVTNLKVKVSAWLCSKIVSGPLLCYWKSDFKIISQKWSPYWDDMSYETFGSLS